MVLQPKARTLHAQARRIHSGRVVAWVLTAAWLAVTTAPVAAQYKITQPDGSVVYTDRPPADTRSRVTSVGTNAARAARTAASGPQLGTPALADAAQLATGLPQELRALVQRYPVTLLTAADCAPCDSGRRLLQQRGVPHAERVVSTAEDTEALQKLLATKTVPALMLGSQPVRGFIEADWNTYLDAAGYPRQSRLPRGWKAPAVTPLVQAAEGSGPSSGKAGELQRTAQVPPPVQTLQPAAPEPRLPAAPDPSTTPRIRF
jgi:glutaredoxin